MKLIQTTDTTVSLEMTREEFHTIRYWLRGLEDRSVELQHLANKLKSLDDEQADELLEETSFCDPEDIAVELKALEQGKGVSKELERITEEGDLTLYL
jgi:hypothetical protein